MANSKEDLAIVVRAGTDQLASDLGRAAGMLRAFGKQIDRDSPKSLMADDTKSLGMLKRVTNAASEAKSRITGAASSMAGFAAKVAITGGTLVALEAGLSGIGSAFDQIKSSVKMAADVEQTTIAFEVMIGSVEKTAAVMGELRRFAAESPFSSKEVTAGARQLLAYGVAANDLIPTLNILGTISAGAKTPLSDEIRRWGTNKVQGHLMQQDVNQYTNAGVKVIPGIAKSLNVEQSQLRKYTEEGRLDVNALSDSLEGLARNEFAGLLDRQAKSLTGSWEQLTDAFDRAKLKLGQVIAQEAGLKGAARDLESFAGQLERAIDGDRFRGGIRLIGDLVKGGGQLAYEFGRAANAIAEINLDGLAKTSPEIAKLAENVKSVVGGLQNFKFDKRATAEFGIGLFKAIALPLADAADYVNVEGKAFKDGFDKNFLEPIREFKQLLDKIQTRGWGNILIDQMPEHFKEIRDRNQERFKSEDYLKGEGIEPPGGESKWLTNKAADVVRASKDLAFFNPPRADEPLDQVRARFAHLEDSINKGKWVAENFGFKQYQPHLDALRMQRGEFLRPFSEDPGRDFEGLRAQFNEGKVPARRPDWKDIAPPTPPPPAEKTRRQAMEDRIAAFESSFFQSFDTQQIRDGFGKLFESIRKTEAATVAGLSPLAAAGALGPLSGITSGLGDIAAAKNSPRLPRDNSIPQRLMDLANKLNPAHDLEEKLTDLDKARGLGLINKDQFDKGRSEVVRDVADKMGLGETHLAGAAMVGSSEDAKLIAQFLSGGGRETTDQLLMDIRELLRAARRDVPAAIAEAASAVAISITP